MVRCLVVCEGCGYRGEGPFPGNLPPCGRCGRQLLRKPTQVLTVDFRGPAFRRAPAVVYHVSAEPEEGVPDGAWADAETRAAVMGRVAAGDEWAWCYAMVTASVEWEGRQHLGHAGIGGCSYRHAADFMTNSGHYETLVEEARLDLLTNIQHEMDAGFSAARLLAAITQAK